MLGLAWGKLLINLNNAVNALSGRTLLEELRQRDYRRVVAASQREGLRLLRRARIRPGKVGPVSRACCPWFLAHPTGCSTTSSLSAGRSTPRAFLDGRRSRARPQDRNRLLNGEFVRLAARLGTAAPVSEKIVELVRKAEDGAPPWAPPRCAAKCLAASGRTLRFGNRGIVIGRGRVRGAGLGPQVQPGDRHDEHHQADDHHRRIGLDQRQHRGAVGRPAFSAPATAPA